MIVSRPSKHILNAQVAIRAPCCKQWFDCAECHAETQDHTLRKTAEMVFMCKKCKKAFRKNMEEYDESDEYCPHCDNHYVSPRAFLPCAPCHWCGNEWARWRCRSSRRRHRRPFSAWKARIPGKMPGAYPSPSSLSSTHTINVHWPKSACSRTTGSKKIPHDRST